MCALIFKQLAEVVNGSKTQTRRLVKSGEIGLCKGVSPITITVVQNWINSEIGYYRTKWQVGHVYAVKSSMYSKGVVWYERKNLYFTDESWRGIYDPRYIDPLRIRITGIRQEHVQDISEQDALAEGIKEDFWINEDDPSLKRMTYKIDTPELYSTGHGSAVKAYAHLWNYINKSKKTNWDANPLVWCLTFEVVK